MASVMADDFIYDKRVFWIKLSNFLKKKKKEISEEKLCVELPPAYNDDFLRHSGYPLEYRGHRLRASLKEQITFPKIIR